MHTDGSLCTNSYTNESTWCAGSREILEEMWLCHFP